MEAKTCCPEGCNCPECEFNDEWTARNYIEDMFVGDFMETKYEVKFDDVSFVDDEVTKYMLDKNCHFVDRNVDVNGKGFFIGCVKEGKNEYIGYRFDFDALSLDKDEKKAVLKVDNISNKQIRFEHGYFVA